jgi:hypothetical protein
VACGKTIGEFRLYNWIKCEAKKKKGKAIPETRREGP